MDDIVNFYTLGKFYKKSNKNIQLNKNINKITNVYQLKCVNGCSTGLGDYIRGCIYFAQLADLLDIEFTMDINNHPISKFLINKNNKTIDYDNLMKQKFFMATWDNYDMNVDDIKLNKAMLENSIALLNFYNTDKMDNVALHTSNFPFTKNIKQEYKDYIKSYFLPNEILTKHITNIFEQLMIEENKYNAIHLRCNDMYFNDNPIDENAFNKLINFAINIINTKTEMPILIVSNNNLIKKKLKQLYPNIRMIDEYIAHVGGDGIEISPMKDDASIITTLTDFFSLIYANHIDIASTFPHGSGFSMWGRVLYNKSYNMVII